MSEMAKPIYKKKTNLLFLSYGEDIVQNKILQNQFIDFIKYFVGEEYSISAHSVMPIARKRIFEFREWKNTVSNVERSMGSRSIVYSYSTVPALASWLYSSCVQLLIVHNLWSYWRLYRKIKVMKVNYIYCRGYHAALAANLLRKISRASYKVHFDPRGMFVEEGIYLRKINRFSAWVWRRIEKFIYESSDLVTFVSKPFASKFLGRYRIKKCLITYTNTNTEQFLHARTSLEIPVTYCFLGHLALGGFYPLKYLLDVFEVLSRKQDSKLVIVTKSAPFPLLREIEDRGMADQVEVIDADTREDVCHILSYCHVGIIPYKPVEGKLERELASSIITIKAAEYLAAGLPIICNGQLSGIADFISEHKIGLNFSIGSEEKLLSQLDHFFERYENNSIYCQELASDYFNYDKNVNLVKSEINRLCVE